jgi:hypothetical protein
MKLGSPILASLALLVSASAAQSAIVSVTGNVQQISPSDIPFISAVGMQRFWNGDLESNTVVRVFDERPGFVLGTSLTRGVAPDISGTNWVGRPPAPALPAGMVVNSHFLHFDPIGAGQANVVATGSVTFDGPILRVLVSIDDLDATDSRYLQHPAVQFSMGLPDVYYTFLGARNLESDDTITVSQTDPRTLFFRLGASTGMDQIRVITAVPVPVPEPSTALLVCASIPLVALAARRARGRREMLGLN